MFGSHKKNQLILLGLALFISQALFARGLPDTGQILCDDGTNTVVLILDDDLDFTPHLKNDYNHV